MKDVNDLFVLNDLSIDREASKYKVLPIPDSKWTIDNRGIVRKSNGKLCSIDTQWDGSMRVHLPAFGVQRWTYINAIVLNVFIGPPPSTKHVPWHKDGDRSNNRIDNLSWVVLGES